MDASGGVLPPPQLWFLNTCLEILLLRVLPSWWMPQFSFPWWQEQWPRSPHNPIPMNTKHRQIKHVSVFIVSECHQCWGRRAEVRKGIQKLTKIRDPGGHWSCYPKWRHMLKVPVPKKQKEKNILYFDWPSFPSPLFLKLDIFSLKKKYVAVRNPCGKVVIEQKSGEGRQRLEERGRPGQQLLRPAPRKERVLCAEQRRQRKASPCFVPAKAGGWHS